MQFSGVTTTGGYSVITGAAPVITTDEYWANVSFLSETVSTNGQTNSTFLDGSTIGATVNRTGTTTQGSYSPYPANNTTSYSVAVNGGSSYYDGATSYLGTASNSAYAFGTDDFTVEAWVNFGSIAGAITPICQSDAVGISSSDKWWFGYTAGALYFACHTGGQPFASIPFTPALNTWYNLAVTRSSGTMRLFINGVSGTVTNGNGGFSGRNLGQGGMSIGAMSSPYYLNGYLSDVRLVKGTALYTATYSVPTAPLTAVSGTSLLLNFTNAGVYDARANSVLISVGTPQAQASTTQAKWSPTSASFSGSAAYLYAPSNTAFAFGTGDFTVEGWVYFNSTSGNQPLGQSDAIGSSTNNKWYLNYTGGQLVFATHASGGFSCSTPFTPSTGIWYYITVTRSSGTMRLFINGVSGSVTTTGTPSGYNLGQGGLTVGGISGPSYLNGYIQDLRLTKGVARYTATFTPPTAALPTNA